MDEELLLKEFSGKIALRLSKELHQMATEAAKKDGMSLNSWLNIAVALRLGQPTPQVRRKKE